MFYINILEESILESQYMYNIALRLFEFLQKSDFPVSYVKENGFS